MAVTYLESLVLRGVSVVSNVGTTLKRIGSKPATDQTSASFSLTYPSPSYPRPACGFAVCRSGSLWGVLASRSHASSALGMVLSRPSLSGERIASAACRRAALSVARRQGPGRGDFHRVQPPAGAVSIAPQDGLAYWPGAMRTLGNARAAKAQFAPFAGAFTASTRGERKR